MLEQKREWVQVRRLAAMVISGFQRLQRWRLCGTASRALNPQASEIDTGKFRRRKCLSKRGSNGNGEMFYFDFGTLVFNQRYFRAFLSVV
jgi:hypothetical protein